MRLGAQQCDKRCIVEPQRALPETAQFQHLPEYRDERTEGVGQSPRKLADRRRWLAHNALNGVTHLDARLAPVAGEVEYIEAVKLRLPLEQLRDGGGDVGQIGPGVADIRLALVQNRADGLAGLDQALREPAVAGRRSEEVAGAHDERAHTVTAGGLEPISSSFHINNAPQVSLSSNRK
jgi:hypothetical protein